MNNQIYSRDCDKQKFYYESIQVKVIKSGYYSCLSHSTMDTYGFIYRNRFDPLNPTENLLQAEDDGGSDSQFRLNIYLSGGMTYVLVMTTYLPKETGLFSISVLGTNKVILERLSKCILPEEIFKIFYFLLIRYSSEHSIDVFIRINC